MLPGPTQIHACARCSAFHRRATLSTGNTLDATRWSDGKVEAPMLPEGPRIARCHACAAFFWLDAKADAFLEVLKQGLARTNDVFRTGGAPWISIAHRAPELRENLERLSALLEATTGSGEDHLVAAHAERGGVIRVGGCPPHRPSGTTPAGRTSRE